MISQDDIQKVYAAVMEADPNQEDEVMSMLCDTLRFVMGYSEETAEQFIENYIREL